MILADVHAGDALPPLSYDVTATTIVLGALAARDWRPMHHDHDFAVNRNGTRDIFMNTPNQAAWFERFLTDWTGPAGRLGRMKFRMKGSVFPGDTMVFEGVVRTVETDAHDCGWVTVDVAVRVGDETMTTCEARIALPTAAEDNPWDRHERALGALRREGPMDLDFTPEQELLRETVRGLCARHAGLDVVRQMEDDPIGYPEKFWLQLAELGLVGLTIPEQWGGSGMSMVDATIVYQELGRAAAPSPHFASSVMAGGVLGHAGSDSQRAAWLPRIAAGEAIVVPAWVEPDRGFGESGIAVRLEGTRVSGTKRHVPFAAAADRLLVLARGIDGVTLVLVDPKVEGVTLTQQYTVGSDTQYRVDFDGAEAEVLAGDGWPVWDTVMRDGIILLAAQAVGGARYALDITVQYAKDRHQFDKPLGAFQAIAHYLADAATAVDGAETLVWEAAWARDTGRDVAKLAPMAKLFACQTFRDVTAMAQQVFGGVGFTVEYDIQLYFRRAKQLQISWWDTRYLEELIASAVLNG